MEVRDTSRVIPVFDLFGQRVKTDIMRLSVRQAGVSMSRSIYKSLCLQETEENILFNDALNTFYLRLYGVEHRYHSDI